MIRRNLSAICELCYRAFFEFQMSKKIVVKLFYWIWQWRQSEVEVREEENETP